MSETAPWWTELYDDAVAEVFLQREDPAEVDYLWTALGLAPGAVVLDQCCGNGRLALPLARRGAHVVGVDLSAAYVARARAIAASEHLPCRFVAADAFSFTPPMDERCDAAFNWGTGFGNAASDEHNLRMLQRAHEALRPGGCFVLEYQHMAHILLEFQPTLVRRSESGQALVLRESSLDLPRGALVQRWTVVPAQGPRRELRTEVRLYLPHELERLLRAAGFTDVRFHGDLSRGPLHARSPRCLALARRPHAAG